MGILDFISFCWANCKLASLDIWTYPFMVLSSSYHPCGYLNPTSIKKKPIIHWVTRLGTASPLSSKEESVHVQRLVRAVWLLKDWANSDSWSAAINNKEISYTFNAHSLNICLGSSEVDLTEVIKWNPSWVYWYNLIAFILKGLHIMGDWACYFISVCFVYLWLILV